MDPNFQGLVLAVLNLIDLVKVEERGNEIDRIEVSLTSFIDVEKFKCSTLTEEKDVAMTKLASLQEELDRLKVQAEEATKRAEGIEKQVAEAKEKYLAERKIEGYERGKRVAELAAVENT
ncbi:uncharacterized protein LOC112091003 [Morus notabilis]|uniref:uncharacterized protein LOC112091003 n=1 Tax=Morus notabilis TaxID=981085 RepID=UPI000CED3AFF|nr:uncharacterized protein LOC112091003 [Morus notabilis]